MTVAHSAFRFHLAGTALLLMTLALLPGLASADDCVTAVVPKAAPLPAKPRPVVRPPVRRPPPVVVALPATDEDIDTGAQAAPPKPVRPKVVVHRKRPPATAVLAASQQAAQKPIPTCAPLADPQAAVRAPLVDVPRYTPIDPPTRLLSESNVRPDPLAGIRTGLPGETIGTPVQLALMSAGLPGGGVPLTVSEKPAPPSPPLPPFPPIEPSPPVVDVIPPVVDTPTDPLPPTPVSAPGSAWLLIAGLLGLLHQRRRRVG